MKNLLRKTAVVTIAFVAAGTVITSPSIASERINFTYKAEDLTTSTGIDKVADRIKRKVRRNCRSNAAPSLWSRNYEKQCIVDATVAILNNIDNARLAAVFDDGIRMAQAETRKNS